MKHLIVLAGALLLGAGLLLFWLPVPLGLPLILVGGSLLIRHSPKARRIVVEGRRNNPWLSRLLRRYRNPDR